ncbi:MAG: serine--tRNA ligase [Oscillospiraceae bacterium]|nr:serine--tRNA ligase [Oscillospiraceae bacterium]
MLNIKQIRESPGQFKAGLARRGKALADCIDRILELDGQKRSFLAQIESLKAEQNAAGKRIPMMKKAKENTDEIMAQMKDLSQKIPGLESSLREIGNDLEHLMLSLPNIPSPDIPEGADSGSNVETRRFQEPREFNFTPRPHWEIGKDLGILDPAAAAKVTGARFHFYKGQGARLERSLYNLFLDTHTQNGYTEILPPYMVNRESMTATGQLPKFEEDAFKLVGTDYFLVPTAEVPLTNMHRQEILSPDDFPIRYCAYTPCFRAEAGSAGRDTRGLIRQHQFNKVELMTFSLPENSYNELDILTGDAERILQMLGLPYRVVTLCAGDLGFSSAKTYDLEVWMPSYEKYVEISSCSNFEDFQARRGAIRYRAEDGKTKFVHTLNGSGLAVGRTVAAILENFQNADGSIALPEALHGYMKCGRLTREEGC